MSCPITTDSVVVFGQFLSVLICFTINYQYINSWTSTYLNNCRIMMCKTCLVNCYKISETKQTQHPNTQVIIEKMQHDKMLLNNNGYKCSLTISL